MAAPKGNQFWKMRSKHGRDKLFATPELLWSAASEYFELCDKNPYINKFGQSVKMPYTLAGLTLYINSNEAYFRNFKKNCDEDFNTVINNIEQTIENQQYIGAVTGDYNPNIIARKLGLSDRQELTGKNGSPLINTVKVKVIRSKSDLDGQ